MLLLLINHFARNHSYYSIPDEFKKTSAVDAEVELDADEWWSKATHCGEWEGWMPDGIKLREEVFREEGQDVWRLFEAPELGLEIYSYNDNAWGECVVLPKGESSFEEFMECVP